MAKIYSEVSATLYTKNSKAGLLTVEKVKELLGWETEETTGKDFGKDFLFRDIEGNKVRLKNNVTNRPFRMSLAKRYSSEMLRQKWAMNGEGFIIDCYGMVQSGQHRGVALVLAEQERKKDAKAAKEEYGWAGPISIEALVVTGVSDKKEVVDTLDLGQKRSLGDVLFRNQDWGKDVTDKEQKQLSNIFAIACRLVWIRTGGQTVSSAPHFPHSEALDFIKAHPGLIDSVKFIYGEESGSGATGKRISTFVSLGYAAALHYLQAAIKTNPETYQATGEVSLKAGDKASKFWVLLASGSNLDSDNPILVLRNYLPKLSADSGSSRDELVGVIVKAFNFWVDGKTCTVKELKMKRTKNEDGAFILAECPKLGGIDCELLDNLTDSDESEEAEEEVEEKPSKKAKKGKKPLNQKEEALAFAPGDKVRVKNESGAGSWLGEVESLAITGQGVQLVNVLFPTDGKIYEVKASHVAKVG